ncbi:MAG TPA: HEPN domain-containing protein [Spirochaetota bacterium]|nr:HEPN domain-containing protein [Spirochaetota bacterium]
MSRENEIDNAIRWLEQAKADIRAAEISLNGGSYEWACFQSQQAGEKILKAYWYHRSLDPWGHSLVKLLNEIPGDRRDFDIAGLMEDAMLLDKMCIPTRYPNGLPDLIPASVYSRNEAQAAIDAVKRILVRIEPLL